MEKIRLNSYFCSCVPACYYYIFSNDKLFGIIDITVSTLTLIHLILVFSHIVLKIEKELLF